MLSQYRDVRVADDAPWFACYSKIDMQGEVIWKVVSSEIIVGMTEVESDMCCC